MLATRVLRQSDLLIRSGDIARAQTDLVAGWEVIHCEAFRDGCLGPIRLTWDALRQVSREDLRRRSASVFSGALKIARNPGGNGVLGILSSHELAGVLLKVKLAALPGYGRQYAPAGGRKKSCGHRQ